MTFPVINVAIASKNPNKVRAVRTAFRLMGIKVSVISIEPPGDLPPEPIGINEIIGGAVKRARHALNRVVNAEFGVGVEAGIISVDALGIHMDVTTAAVVDRDGEVTIGMSPAFMIPRRFMKEILSGKELNDVVEKYYGIKDIGKRFGFIGAVTRGLIEREILNVEAIYMALIPRMPWNKNLYH